MENSKYEFYREIIVSGKVSPKKIAELIGNGCTAEHVRAAKQRFLHPKKCKENQDRWRKNNPEKIHRTRKKYRNPSREFATNKDVSYTDAEDSVILLGEEKGEEIAEAFGRSVDAIYRRRVRLNKKTQNM